MTDLEDKIRILRHREDRLRAAQEGLKSLGEQQLEATRKGDLDRADAMNDSFESHRKDIIQLPSLIAKLRDELDRRYPGWNEPSST